MVLFRPGASAEGSAAASEYLPRVGRSSSVRGWECVASLRGAGWQAFAVSSGRIPRRSSFFVGEIFLTAAPQ